MVSVGSMVLGVGSGLEGEGYRVQSVGCGIKEKRLEGAGVRAKVYWL